jgi:hypothetical protein
MKNVKQPKYLKKIVLGHTLDVDKTNITLKILHSY